MSLRSRVSLVLAGLLVLAAPAYAENDIEFGAQLSWADDTDIGIGARAQLGTNEIVEQTRVAASFDWFFPDGGTGVDFSYFEFNINGHYMLPIEAEAVDFYAGGGINIARASIDYDDDIPFIGGTSVSDTEIGLNLLGGVDFDINENLGGFGELRIELGGGEQFVLTGGVMF